MKPKSINVLSLFDGMSCGQMALERVGILVKGYYASEIDKYAIQVTQSHYPKTIQLGDIQNWKKWRKDIPVPDLIIAGSPCQGFSLAGRRLNFDDPRSKLFFVFLDILKYYQKINPKLKWLLENVKMKKEWENKITELMEVNPILIDSALVSAQSRKRLYWSNFKIVQPSGRGIVLADIIESGEVDLEKSYTIDANYYKGGNPKSYFEKGRRQLVFEHQSHKRAMVKVQGVKFVKGLEEGRRLHDGKSLSRNYHEGYRIYSPLGKAVSLSAQPKGGAGGYSGLYQIGIIVGMANDIKGKDQWRRIYSKNGKSPTLVVNGGGHHEPKIAIDDVHYRKLTCMECERLQTVPDNWTAIVSNTQRYKMLGNGWTVDVIAHIFNCMKQEKKKENNMTQRNYANRKNKRTIKPRRT